MRPNLAKLSPWQVGLAGVAVSALSSLTVLAVSRLTQSSSGAGDQSAQEGGSRDADIVQPAVDVAMPAQAPDHFSEELIVPGFTETGQQVEQQDDTEGRSPEGV